MAVTSRASTGLGTTSSCSPCHPDSAIGEGLGIGGSERYGGDERQSKNPNVLQENKETFGNYVHLEL